MATSRGYVDVWLGNDLKRPAGKPYYYAPPQQESETISSTLPSVVTATSTVYLPLVTLNLSASRDALNLHLDNVRARAGPCLVRVVGTTISSDFKSLDDALGMLRSRGMLPLALAGNSECLAAGTTLPVLEESTIVSTPTTTAQATSSEPVTASSSSTSSSSPPSTSPLSAMVHYGTVRSGQQLFADGRSLVVVGTVNSGAEVMADGDIHVYGRLQGRAMAGMSGCESATVFARSFEASLVGIAGTFILPDEVITTGFPALSDVQGRAVAIHLNKKDACGTVSLQGSKHIVIPCEDERELVFTTLASQL